MPLEEILKRNVLSPEIWYQACVHQGLSLVLLFLTDFCSMRIEIYIPNNGFPLVRDPTRPNAQADNVSDMTLATNIKIGNCHILS